MYKNLKSICIYSMMLMISPSCKMDERESFRLNTIFITIYDLLEADSVNHFFPVKYDKIQPNDFCLIACDFSFEFLDLNENTCPLEPGCNGATDSLIAVSVQPDGLLIDTTSSAAKIFIDEDSDNRQQNQPLPYNPNQIRLVREYDTHPEVKHLSHIQELITIYNSDSNKRNPILFYDHFFFISKKALNDQVALTGAIDFKIVTSHQTIEIHFQNHH